MASDAPLSNAVRSYAGLPRFVHSAEQRGERVVGFEAIRNAHIVNAKGRFKGMRRFILSAAIEIIAKALNDRFAKIPHFLFVIFFVQEIVFHLFARGDGFDQLHLLRAQFIEDRLYVGSLHTGFIVVEQRIIRMIGLRVEGYIFANQFNDLFKVRLEDRKIRFRFRFNPRVKGFCRNDRLFNDEGRRHALRFFVASRGDANHRGFVGAGFKFRF